MDTNLQKKSNKFDLDVPSNKNDLINSLSVVREGINKVNRAKMLDLKGAVSLRDLLRHLSIIIDNVVKACYKDEKIVAPMITIDIPDKQRLEIILKNLFCAIDAAQKNGVYETIDESGNLYDGLNIIASLLNSMIRYIECKEKEKELKSIPEEDADSDCESMTNKTEVKKVFGSLSS